ncbi:RDD family protein [Hyunsoonleella sp. SJ7]|uniref:RDD family protein n=1 Tax=Hyunsoonleella aquatilis TaxID=2762758 RepID=A0A923H739_9FLAO|nr:RDD family protein [Hyunsoonleella aquatilis]MBC3756940.1 RDD family protein [Hyunsoonleella aquatilis]
MIDNLGLKTKRILSFGVDISILNTFVDFLITNYILHEWSYDFYVLGQEFTVNLSYSWVICLLYFFAFDIFNSGCTVGKMLFNLNLVSPRSKPKQSILLLRTLVKSVCILLMPLFAILYLAFDKIFYDEWFKIYIVESGKRDVPLQS